ncbi:hypothetical protein FA95DRAFT_1368583 [Auriscalpium vulgare]|uniref:Uncharacterized protein n=1 Tax=Auriscalpium vulgare TaxID=40419 RepID=A0ACB8RRA7_9AGAM|nr:hypothetical protein FA95DRAFT_1368583 [Auriscalpium vulgare]
MMLTIMLGVAATVASIQATMQPMPVPPPPPSASTGMVGSGAAGAALMGVVKKESIEFVERSLCEELGLSARHSRVLILDDGYTLRHGATRRGESPTTCFVRSVGETIITTVGVGIGGHLGMSHKVIECRCQF